MIVYRLSKTRFADDLLGKGAEISGGRWNSKGVAMVYTSESRALATTEIAVHSSLSNIPLDYNIITIEISDELIFVPNFSDLPIDWSEIPPKMASQQFGDRFILENKYLAMKVPSAVVDGDFNFIINPYHTNMNLVKLISISPFSFDKRLLK